MTNSTPASGIAPIDVGSRVTKEEIEAAFETGFGYQISGINPRRDEHGDRYVLVFANEEGPYTDTITEGTFEYIGEGLEGDQDPTSTGNSALIDAIETDFPIYFFYTTSQMKGWEFRGQIEVQEYKTEIRDGRDVLVFKMQQQIVDNPITTDGTGGLYLIPISDSWREAFRQTVEVPLSIERISGYPPELLSLKADRVWATTTTESDRKQSHAEAMERGDVVLFYHDGELLAGGRVSGTVVSAELGAWLWESATSKYLFGITEYTKTVPPIASVWDRLGYEGRPVVQGFQRVVADRLTELNPATWLGRTQLPQS